MARTSLACACGARWKCMPRSVLRAADCDVLFCTKLVTRPCSANARAQNVRAKEPR